MKLKLVVGICIIVLLLPIVLASGSVETGSLSPNSVELCGDNAQYVTLTAKNITNQENNQLNSVTAKLHIMGNSGLSFITSQTVNLGNIPALGQYSGNPAWTIQCNSPNSGSYTAYVNYSSQNGYKGSSLGEAVSTITVEDNSNFLVNYSIIEHDSEFNETDFTVITDSTPTIKVWTSKDATCKGTLDNDEPYSTMDFLFYGLQREHNYTFTSDLTEGEHTVYVRCKDNSGNVMQNSLLVNFLIDTKLPKITINSPGSVVTAEYTELKITVNEEAVCRYHKENKEFSKMNKFVSTVGNTFSSQFTGLDQKEYKYYVKCKDNVGNIAVKEVSFEVKLPPTAEIVLEEEQPLTKGVYEVQLRPSKKLRQTPELSYTFSDEPNFNRNINLIKEDSYFKGYLIIEESDQTRSGVFSFLGYDLSGIEGTEVTEGAIFLVDTVKPPAPQSVEGIATKDDIEIRWYYDGEKPDHFNIYRSTSEEVGPINFYATTTRQRYDDDDVRNGQLYYYKVAAVDKAGNVGTLSKEISVYSESGGTSSSSETTVTKNAPTAETRKKKEDLEKRIESFLIDLDWARNNLKEQETSESAVSDLALGKQVIDAKQEVDKLSAQLGNIDLKEVSDSELRNTMSKIESSLSRIRKTTPQSLDVVEKTEIIQSISPSDVELAVAEFMKTGNYSDSQISTYTQQMKEINEKVRVEAEAKVLRIEYLDESTEDRIKIDKKLNYEGDPELNNVIALEVVPKTVAGDISSIDIKTPEYAVINEDPIFSWQYDTLSFDKKSQTYLILSSSNLDSVKSAKTIVLINPLYAITESKNLITGFGVFISNISNSGLEIFGLILGFVVVLGLGMYYIVVVNEVDISSYLQTIQKFRLPSRQEKQQIEVIKESTQDMPEHEGKREKNFDYLFRTDDPIRTIPEQYFHLRNGDVIRSVTELREVVSELDDFTFYYHVHEQGNDFADWVESVYHNKELADLLRHADSKEELMRIIQKIS